MTETTDTESYIQQVKEKALSLLSQDIDQALSELVSDLSKRPDVLDVIDIGKVHYYLGLYMVLGSHEKLRCFIEDL